MRLKRQEKWQHLKRLIVRELNVVIIGAVTYAGVSSFLAIGKPYWGDQVSNYQLLAIVITIIGLRKIYGKIQRIKGPWLIKLTVAFSEGFLAIKDIMPSISNIMTQAHGFWKNISKKL